MTKLFILIIGLSNFSAFVFSQQVTVKGNAKSYADTELSISTFSEQITYTEKIIAKSKVDKNGDFLFKFDISKTQLVFIHLNVFKGLLYVEPTKDYKIVLPEKREKLPADKLNPFFEETEFYVTVLNKDTNDLNFRIKKFDDLYSKYVNKYFKLFNGKLNKQTVDTIIGLIENELAISGNPFFEKYVTYNFAILSLIAYERNPEKLIAKYFSNREILFENSAYMDLFNQVFNNYLSVLYLKPKGKIIPYNLIREKSLKRLKHSLDSFPYLKDENLKDLLIIKSLKDNFYKDDFPQEDIIFMIDSVRISTDNKHIKIIAENVLNKITHLLAGYSAPEFYLADTKNNYHANSSFRNKFVYLNFASPESYTCLQDFKLLDQLQKQNIEMLEIVTICVTDDIETMKRFVKKNKYKWKFLFYDKNNKLLKDYKVKAYPTYYLLNPEGRLSMSPAFPPSESSFENRYFDILKAWKIDVQRRKYNKGKGTNR